MMQIDLLPHRAVARAAQRARFHRALAMAALLAVGVAVVLHGLLDLQTERLRADHRVLQAAIAGLDAQLQAGAAQRAELARLAERQRSLLALQAERDLPAQLLGELALRVPEGVQLTRLAQEPQHVVLQGSALSSERVPGLLRQLDRSALPDGGQMRAVLVEMAAGAVSQGEKGSKEALPAVHFTLRVGLAPPQTSAPTRP